MNKILIVYYSRTGTTKKVAEVIKEKLGPACAGRCDIEEIISAKNRSGVIGYILSGKEATQKTPAEIKPTTKNPDDYDLIILGTPVWAWNISSPMRTYIMQNKEKFKKLSAFCTMGTNGDKRSFTEIENICNQKLVVRLALLTIEVLSPNFKEKVESYCATIINQVKN
jgi:flavodoxin